MFLKRFKPKKIKIFNDKYLMDTRYTFTWGFILVGLFVLCGVLVNFCMCVEFLYKRFCKKNKVCQETINTLKVTENNIGETCSICLDVLDENSLEKSVKLINCNHIFHKECIEKWYKNSENVNCPVCRDSIEVTVIS